ncbi:MAG: efflux RND transporter permease subunit [Bacteroidota bacterium]
MLLQKPIASAILVFAVLLFGGVALSRLSIELMPDVAEPTLLVRTDYAGAPASDVELRINEPLEGVLSGVRGVQAVRSLARQGQGLVFLTFNWGTDMDIAFLNVREKLDQVRFFLPEEADRPQLIYTSASDQPIAILAVTLKGVEQPTIEQQLALKRLNEQVLSRRFEQQPGIAQAIIVGAIEPEVHIRFKPALIERYGISLSAIQQAVQDANVFTASGELRDGWYRYAIKVESRINRLDDIRAIPVISLASGRVLKLEEIADVELAREDPVSFAHLNGQNVQNILIKKEYGANTVTVFETVQQTLSELRSQYPDVELTVVKEEATYIENSIFNLLQTLFLGSILAFLVLFLFLNDARTPFTIGISIPVSIFLTFLAMFGLNIQLNIISLSGLTLGIGLLLDNSIVVLENINRYRKQGVPLLEAARKGTREIALPVTASTFTTISVFFPLLFLGGFEGAFFRDLAATLSISLVSSLLVALFILPVFAVQFSQSRTPKGLFAAISSILERIIEAYERGLTTLLRRPWPVVVGTVLLVAGAVFTFSIISKEVIPPSEPKEITYHITLSGNTALRSTDEAAKKIQTFVQDRLNTNRSVLSIGGYTDASSPASIVNEALNKFTLSVNVSGFDDARMADRLIRSYVATFADWSLEEVENQTFTTSSSNSDAPIQFSIVGKNRALSEKVAEAFENYLKGRFADVRLQKKYPQTIQSYQIRFLPDQLFLFELTEQEVITYLESLSRGTFITDWNQQDEQVAIRLLSDAGTSVDPEQMVLELKNKRIPLYRVASVVPVTEPEQLERTDQTAVLTFASSLSFVDWWWRKADIRAAVQEFVSETGYEVRVSGSALQTIALLQEMGLLLLISIILIYLILAIQYENLKYPFIIILAIPLAWIGSFFAMAILGVSLNALSFMGLLILTGIAVNDAILKVDFMRRYLSETGNLDEAIRQAGIHRFRPVVMTSATTILGLIPMLIPYGDGYIFRQSLAVALMGGMLTSTLLTLYVIPIVFKWLEKDKTRASVPNATLP